MICSNCDAKVKDGEGLNVCLGSQGESVTRLCETCVKGVLTLKIVLARRTEKDVFSFEGYLPVSSVK